VAEETMVIEEEPKATRMSMPLPAAKKEEVAVMEVVNSTA